MSSPARLVPQVRIRTLLSLSAVSDSTTSEDVASYLSDPHPEVRRTALALLAETTEDWQGTASALATALSDPDSSVRHLAIGLLRELRDVLEPSEVFESSIRRAALRDDPDVRVAALEALWRHRLTNLAELRKWRHDASPQVRRELVAAFVAFDGLNEVIALRTDGVARVRAAVATALGTIGDPRGATAAAELAIDSEPSVRAAALNALARTGLSNSAGETAANAVNSPFWEVRAAAATALSVEVRDFAVAALARVAGDRHHEVRRAAVRSLAEKFAGQAVVRELLRNALSDPDPAVVAYARFGLGARLKQSHSVRSSRSA